MTKNAMGLKITISIIVKPYFIKLGLRVVQVSRVPFGHLAITNLNPDVAVDLAD